MVQLTAVTPREGYLLVLACMFFVFGLMLAPVIYFWLFAPREQRAPEEHWFVIVRTPKEPEKGEENERDS